VVPTSLTRTPSDALVGPVAVAALRMLHVDRLFLGVHGIDLRAGLTTPNLVEAETNRAMIASSRRLCVLADHTKWGTIGLSTITELADVHHLVTDSGLPTRSRSALAEVVGELIVAPVPAVREASVSEGA
jgi:DeoR/GlpR family transcriptional regulator of sugar metabolism